MKIWILILISLSIGNMTWAQNQADMRKIEAARIGLISERLSLTPEQAEKFWPVYNEYSQRRKEVRQELSTARQDIDLKNASEEERRGLIELGLKLKEKDLAIEKEYSDKLLRVISSQQLIRLKKAEDDFREMLLHRLHQQRSPNRGENPMRNNPQERMDRRRNN